MKYILALILALLPALARADGWDALSQPGAVAIMRHALAPGIGDPAGFDVDDCSTQRNLDDRGRAQARAIGAAFRARGIGFDSVLTSQWCRCRETAELLGFGAPRAVPALNSFFEDRTSRDAQTAATLALIEAAEGPAMLVTHQVNITALTGQSVASGEVFVVRVANGQVEVLGRIAIAP